MGADATGADFLTGAIGEWGPLEVGEFTGGAGRIVFGSANTIAVVTSNLRTFGTDGTDTRHVISFASFLASELHELFRIPILKKLVKL